MIVARGVWPTRLLAEAFPDGMPTGTLTVLLVDSESEGGATRQLPREAEVMGRGCVWAACSPLTSTTPIRRMQSPTPWGGLRVLTGLGGGPVEPRAGRPADSGSALTVEGIARATEEWESRLGDCVLVLHAADSLVVQLEAGVGANMTQVTPSRRAAGLAALANSRPNRPTIAVVDLAFAGPGTAAVVVAAAAAGAWIGPVRPGAAERCLPLLRNQQGWVLSDVPNGRNWRRRF